MTARKTLSILIPVYNEKGTVLQLLDADQQAPLDLEKELVVVDDGSTDGTRERLRELERGALRGAAAKGSALRVIYKDRNEG